MKYLLTGTAGFIAARTAELLLADGHEVIGVDNLNDYYDVRLKHHRLERLETLPGFTFHRMDIEHKEALDGLFRQHRFDAVINLAARAGVRYSVDHPGVYLTTNAGGTLHLLENMRAHGVGKIVLASTSSLYAGQPMPFVEDLPVNTPISPYAATKKAAEMLCYSYRHLFDIDVSILRYFTVYGPAGRPDMAVFRFIKKIDDGTPIEIYGDGRQARDFTYIDDIARGTLMALRPVGYEVINLGGGRRPVTVNEVIGIIESLLGKKADRIERPFHKADVSETSADIRKAAAVLGWAPEIDIREGLERTVEWHAEQRGWLRDYPV